MKYELEAKVIIIKGSNKLDEIQTSTISFFETLRMNAFGSNISKKKNFDLTENTTHFGHKIVTKVGNTAFGSNDDHGIKIEF